MTNIVYIAQSLDGYIAGPNGELDWLEQIDNPTHDDFGFTEFMSQVDALIMGRNTYEKVLSFGQWPYDKPVYVASSQLTEIPETLNGKAFIVNGSPHQMLSKLKAEGHSAFYIDGGALIQSFIREDLIDELIITTVPVILGEGIRLFGHSEKSVRLKLTSSGVLLNQLVKTHYVVER
ncbi:dihydrofolate reductase family protein [Corallincola platygyrae]|uniref:Dihydrofolate reductase family protein n=1 Tax=Corallincola platygyrae TaxID=1193278 RepID=A0ABW4XPR0_9GAMM